MQNSSRRLRVENLEHRRLLAADSMIGPQHPDAWGEVSVELDPSAGESGSTREVSGREAEGESVLQVRLDFSLDSSNFFTTRYPQAKAVMQEVVNQVVDRFNDTLAAVNPPSRSQIQWQPAVLDPRTGALTSLPQSFRAAANEIVVYVRGNNLTGLTRGLGGYNSFGVGYNCPDQACVNQANAFISNLTTRGETGAAASTPSDFAPVVGAITIDTRSEVDWNFGAVDTGESGQSDFRAVVAHEFAHVLGFGTAPSFNRYVSGGRFAGPKANAIYPGSANIPMNGSSHLASSVRDVVPTTMTNHFDGMLSDLDYAILDDIGWELTPDTRPTVQITTTEQTVPESAGTVAIVATLSAAPSQSISVPVVISGTALAGSDYTVTPAAFNFAVGQRTATMTVNVIDDTTNEGMEALTIRLADSSVAKLGADTEALVTILDDDGSPVGQTQLNSADFSGTPITVPGNNQPVAYLFRASAKTTLRVTKVGATASSEAFFVLDENLQPIGQYSGSGDLSVTLSAYQNYVLRFEARASAEQYQIASTAGFQSISNDSPTNLLQPSDVSGDGEVSALDALRVINALNAAGASEINIGNEALEQGNYYDVTGDGKVTSLDALRVINSLSSSSTANAESGLASSSEVAFAAGKASSSSTDAQVSDGLELNGFVPAVVSVRLLDHDHSHVAEDHDDQSGHDDTHHEEHAGTSSSVLAPALVDSFFVEFGASCLA
ncbi:dockerin type I domain-containing protein [Rhodopirellula sp. P2]|uniref:dockerin type I domain-containing protein n=1 Tax=Rhodopirellula sp. P2 TaxID=2127060 RepID=UPI002368C3EC|nr:dockerin type I domain-containing protein [Rhodopirellula sp. P2]WDQ17691.1 dockerin type I domain-containing protein [Rhodopirellula sp. P2]